MHAFWRCVLGPCLCWHGIGAQIVLYPSADATLIQVVQTNSSGGGNFFNSGTTQNGNLNRALLRFDLSSLPTNAVIFSATVEMEVIQIPVDGYEAAFFGLHRMLRSWGEGTNAPTGTKTGTGLPARTNDATWTHRFAYTAQAWAAPGGAPDADFAPNFSLSKLVEAYGRYTFESTTESTSDVQFWVQHPELNHGWMLLCQSEESLFTARKFASRENENPTSAPTLAVDYVLRPRLTSPSAATNNIQFQYTAEPGQTYIVQRATNLPPTAWVSILTNPPVPVTTAVTISDPRAASCQFYRVRTF